MEGRKIQRASQEQNNFMLEFIQHNPELVNNKTLMHGETLKDRQKKWIQLSEQLNAIGPKQSDFKGWQALWKDWRRRVKRRASEVITAQRGTGGGPKAVRDLNDEETTVMNLIGLQQMFQTFNFESTTNSPSVQQMEAHVVSQEEICTVELIPEQTQQEETHRQIDQNTQTEQVQPKSKQRRRMPESVSAQLIGIVQQAFSDNKELQERQIKALETRNELLLRQTDTLANLVRTQNELVLRQTIALQKLAEHFELPHKNTSKE